MGLAAGACPDSSATAGSLHSDAATACGGVEDCACSCSALNGSSASCDAAGVDGASSGSDIGAPVQNTGSGGPSKHHRTVNSRCEARARATTLTALRIATATALSFSTVAAHPITERAPRFHAASASASPRWRSCTGCLFVPAKPIDAGARVRSMQHAAIGNGPAKRRATRQRHRYRYGPQGSTPVSASAPSSPTLGRALPSTRYNIPRRRCVPHFAPSGSGLKGPRNAAFQHVDACTLCPCRPGLVL